jgi:lysophospholipase L1-like esterase
MRVPPGQKIEPGRRQLLCRRLGLAAGATLLSLLAVELLLHVFPPPVVYAYERNVVQVYSSQPHPTVQYVNRERFAGEFNNREFHTHVRINERGLRDRDYPYQKPPGVRRVLLLGDSFVFGWGVEAEESIAKQLERRLAGVEVLNGGCSGWSTAQEGAFLRDEGIRYDPDVVLLFFCENDVEANEARYHFTGGELRGSEEGDGWIPDLKRFLARHVALWALQRHARQTLALACTPRAARARERAALWQREVEYLRDIQERCRAHGARLGLVYVPLKGRGGKPERGPWFPRLQEFCAAAAIPILDLVPPLTDADRSRRVYFRLDDHWTPWGHQAAGAAAEAFLFAAARGGDGALLNR